MEIKNYAEAVAEVISERTDLEVTVKEVEKNNNQIYTGIIINEKSERPLTICPTIYVDGFFHNDFSIEDAAREILTIYQNNKNPEFEFDLDKFNDFETVKDRIYPRLVNLEKNKDRDVLIRQLEDTDLAFLYVIQISDEATTVIRKEHLKLWGVTQEEVFNAAKRHTPVLKTMLETLKELNPVMFEELPEEALPDDKMFIVSNDSKVFGATVVTDAEFMNSCKEKIGDFYILPSSIHECILLKKEEGMQKETLKAMVEEVNDTQVAPEEILSYNVYEWDGTKLVIAS